MQKYINLGHYWIVSFSKGNSLVSLHKISKDLNIPPLSGKCLLAQIRCFRKWKKSKSIISKLINTKAGTRKHTWTIESQRFISRTKNCEISSVNELKNFYWEGDVKKNSKKAVVLF